MPQTHIVQQGECLSSIAQEYGFRDYKTVYQHGDNSELRKKRPNPNVIYPGDKVVIPDRDPKEVSVATGKVHAFTVKTPGKLLRVKLLVNGHDAIANEPYELDVGGESFTGTTDGDGQIEQIVPIGATSAEVRLVGRRLTLNLGALNPLRDTGDTGLSGAQARLHNLGFDAGPSDGILGPRTRGAAMLFQAEQGIPVTGKIDDATLGALAKQYGV
jgi:hypothetical protein